MISKKGHVLQIETSASTKVEINLNNHKVGAEESAILDKAVAALKGKSLAQLSADGCPAQAHLDAHEFNRVKHLKASLTSSGGGQSTDRLIADFCIHLLIID